LELDQCWVRVGDRDRVGVRVRARMRLRAKVRGRFRGRGSFTDEEAEEDEVGDIGEKQGRYRGDIGEIYRRRSRGR